MRIFRQEGARPLCYIVRVIVAADLNSTPMLPRGSTMLAKISGAAGGVRPRTAAPVDR